MPRNVVQAGFMFCGDRAKLSYLVVRQTGNLLALIMVRS